jgi:hypothetical protein
VSGPAGCCVQRRTTFDQVVDCSGLSLPLSAGAAAWVVIIGVKTALELAKAELQKLEEEFSRQ